MWNQHLKCTMCNENVHCAMKMCNEIWCAMRNLVFMAQITNSWQHFNTITGFSCTSIRPLGNTGFPCVYSISQGTYRLYTSLGPYKIFMHLYVPWAIQDLHASIRSQGASGGQYGNIWQYGLIYFANFILYEGCITVGGVYLYIIMYLHIYSYTCRYLYQQNLKKKPY